MQIIVLWFIYLVSVVSLFELVVAVLPLVYDFIRVILSKLRTDVVSTRKSGLYRNDSSNSRRYFVLCVAI